MSDFDKEAERERLREKYEQDKQKREATEQMSELLLQGATMTNAHCSECNDPIFRYDGQEFCATCERPVDRDTGDETDGEAATDDESAENIEVTAPSEDARVQFGGDGDDSRSEADEQQTAARQDAPRGRDEQQDARRRQTRQQRDQRTTRQRAPQSTERSQPAPDLREVEASLVRTMTRFAEQAEATEDPQQAAESLAAVREAAEARDALRR